MLSRARLVASLTQKQGQRSLAFLIPGDDSAMAKIVEDDNKKIFYFTARCVREREKEHEKRCPPSRFQEAIPTLPPSSFSVVGSWCPPCKKIAPVFEQLSKEHPSLSFVKIDVDQFGAVSQEYGIRSVPTFFFINGGEVISEFSGAAEAQLKQSIEELERA